MVASLKLLDGTLITVDNDDVDRISRHIWKSSPIRNASGRKCIHCIFSSHLRLGTLLHRFVLGLGRDDGFVSFRNGDHFDFRKENMVVSENRPAPKPWAGLPDRYPILIQSAEAKG